MSLSLPNGSIVSIATTYDEPVIVTAISNAKPASASAVGHTFLAGDILEVNSGWSRLAERVARVADPDVSTFELENIDTSNTGIYPTGGGAGTARKVLTWTEISQILDNSQSGGEQQFYNFNYLSDEGDERQMPTQRSAKAFSFTMADDDSLPHYPVLEAATEEKKPRIVRIRLPGGAYIYWNAYVSFDPTPTLTRNQGMAVMLSLSLAARITRYAA